jgi:aminopeptidase YwaD
VHPLSPEKMLEAMPSIALKEEGVPWFLDFGAELEAQKDNPHFDREAALQEKVRQAADKGATALLVFNDPAQRYNPKLRGQEFPIPVVVLDKTVTEKYFSDETDMLEIKLKTAFTKLERTGRNVIGYLDNGAQQTVILGAHFDHLGYGEDGNSMVRQANPGLHNGADDNASGTAALIELARLLKKDKSKTFNYLFIAFSAEELGLFGSKYFTENATVPLNTVNYMINMDMVGRLNDSSKALTIGGYGTSPAWSSTFSSISDTRYFNIKYDSSGTGPSDHSSFYRKDIPVLFFFTGLHTDYHKPSDDADKINYTGQLRIVQLIQKVIKSTAGQPKLAFTKTREQQMGTSARFTVSLGIMPDYAFSGNGVRVDGVSEGRAAQKAGMKAGDIIIKLGDYPIASVEQYMQALSKFKKGDKTTVVYKRESEELSSPVEF